MSPVTRGVVIVVLLWIGAPSTAVAQSPRWYAGAALGVSALSADGRSVSMPPRASLSLYKPENGLALNTFAGIHLAEYFSVQANYMWNRNDLTLVASALTADSGGFYEQRRRSAQHAMVADGLIYFRRRDSAIRPYLATGLSVFRFTSGTVVSSVSNNLSAPLQEIASTRIALRSSVGVDIALSRAVSLRYTFSETISRNPISPHLMPMGERRLGNFQNLIGVVAHF